MLEFTLLIVIIVSLAACGDYSSSATSQVPVQSLDVESTDSENIQETPSAQPTGEEQKNKYNVIKFDLYDENEILSGYGEYEYDKNGNVLRDSGYSLDGTATSVMTYEYDFYQDGTISEKRMIWETLERISISNYSYDEHGNLTANDQQSREKKPVDDGSIYLGGYSQTNSDLGRVYSYALRTFTYDSNGRAIRFDMTDKNSGEALGWGEITYDVTGTLATYNVYNRDGELSYQGETLYDAEHRALSIKYIEDGEITDWYKNEYDEYGYCIKSSTYGNTDAYNWAHWIYAYDLDGKLLSMSMYWDDTLMGRSIATEWIPFSAIE